MATSNALPLSAPSNKGVRISVWIVSGLVAAMFLAAGVNKLLGNPEMVAMFQQIGLGQWFRYVTGVLEVGGAAGLLMPRYSFYAALLLSAVMIGAILTHLVVLGNSPAVPAVLLAFTAAIAYLRRPR